MSAAAILSIKPVYANRILAGTKTIELRKSSMGLHSGDIIVVYASAPEQRIHFWFQIRNVETLAVEEMWNRYSLQLGIDYKDYAEYFSEQSSAVAFHIGNIQRVTPIPLKMIEDLVPQFVPPQGLIWLRDEFGKFEQLLTALSQPLPGKIFAQQSLTF